jgi:hypothetical protein
MERAKQLIGQLAGYSDEKLGGLATVGFAGRALRKVGQAITPEKILNILCPIGTKGKRPMIHD